MEAAVKAVTDWSKNYREIAKFYGVEKQKLFRVVNGAQKMDAKKGRPTIMPKEVEDMLAQKLMQLIKNHFCRR